MVTFVQSGWPHTVSDNIKPFLVRRDELSSEQRCLMWGGHESSSHERIGQGCLMNFMGGHMGVVKMKALARAHVWWPDIDQDIEGASQSCAGWQVRVVQDAN